MLLFGIHQAELIINSVW